jgi:hypothetical protein
VELEIALFCLETRSSPHESFSEGILICKGTNDCVLFFTLFPGRNEKSSRLDGWVDDAWDGGSPPCGLMSDLVLGGWWRCLVLVRSFDLLYNGIAMCTITKPLVKSLLARPGSDPPRCVFSFFLVEAVTLLPST